MGRKTIIWINQTTNWQDCSQNEVNITKKWKSQGRNKTSFNSSTKWCWIWKSLLWMFMSHRCCHLLWRNLLIIGFKSVYGMKITLGLRSKADSAAKSALLFPLTPMWLGIQHKIIFLWLDIESSLLNSLTINRFPSFLFSSDVNTESESENMINFLCLSLETPSKFRPPSENGDQPLEHREENKSLYPDCALVIQGLLMLSYWNRNHNHSVWHVRQLARLNTFL